MFRSIFRAIDGLFYTKTTTIRTKKVATYSDPDVLEKIRQYCRDNGITMVYPDSTTTASRTTVVADDAEFVLGDRVIAIPEAIRNLQHIEDVDVTNFEDFPLESSEIIISMRELAPTRSLHQFGVEPKEVPGLMWSKAQIHSLLEDLAERSGSDDAVLAESSYADMRVTSVIYDDWNYTLFVGPFGRVSVATSGFDKGPDAVGIEYQSAACACIIARAFLLTLRMERISIDDYNEHSIRSVIIALLLADRS